MIIVLAMGLAAASCEQPTEDQTMIQEIEGSTEIANSFTAIDSFLRTDARGRECPQPVVDMFLKIDGIEGESKDADHEGEIDVLSFNWGLSFRVASSQSSRGLESGAGKASVQDLSINKWADSASPDLRRIAGSGEAIPEAEFSLRTTCGDRQHYWEITMKNATISSYQTGISRGHTIEIVTLSSAGPEVGWDIRKNEPV